MYFAATALLAASCASDEIVEETNNGYQPDTKAPISFITNQKNITRSMPLQDAKHYNFGVFAYKSTETVNNIMDNYLVGYSDETNSLGYKFGDGQTTKGDKEGLVDGKSMWQYEKLGNKEYDYSGEGFYKASETKYMSNVDYQYLRYWDMAAPYTYFYAYSPYINGTETATYVDGTTNTLTIPDGLLVDGYDDPALCEYMYASAKIAKADYGKDVRLEFKRLNAKVNIKFWEDIEGYSVRILDLKEGTYKGVQAAPSILSGTTYSGGQYFVKNGVSIKFTDGVVASPSDISQKTGTTASTETPLIFAAPTAAQIGTTRIEASPSATDYYAIPKNNTTGFTFHVSYELTSTTGERIVVKNATVRVPEAYANWVMNTHYTYIFKITKNSNGSTDPADDSKIDPKDPAVPTEEAFYPIIFDNCTVEEWVENESEWNITDGTKLSYYDVQLSKNSIATGNIDVTISVDNLPAGETIDYANVTVVNKATGAADAKVTYDASTKKITVADGAATGVYTVTYTCHTTAAGDGNHPSTWSEYFVVGNAYTVSTYLSEVGTGGKDVAKLAITTTKDNSAEATPTGTFKIEYPKNLTDDGKVAVSGSNVTVATDAAEGSYVLAYVVGGNIVARKEFKVVKYSLVLSQNVVGLNNPAVVINAEKRGSITGTISMATATGITVNDAAGTITVENTAATGSYTVVYTVNSDNASKIVYEQTLTLKNTYAVSLSATQIDHDASPAESITITTKKNGDAITGQTTKLSVVSASGAAVSGITISDAQVLTVTSAVAPGNYKVVYTGETGVTAEVEFTVVD